MEELIKYLNEINYKRTINNIISWEIDTIAPKKANDLYIDIISKISTEILEMKTSDKYLKLLNNAIKSEEFNKLEEHKKRYILNLKEEYEEDKRIPKDFYREFVKQRSTSKIKWEEAKKKNDYSIFKPYLEKNIEMSKEIYKYKNPDATNIYDAMLNDYEKGIKSKDIDKLFDDLKTGIIPIIKSLKPKELPTLSNNMTKKTEFEIARYLLNYIGFDNNRGALGNYTHGYTSTISKNDVRIAYEAKDIIDLVTTIIHEGGHGIFEQTQADEFDELTICDNNLLALHESQSRFYENILGRNKNFWIPIYDDIKKMGNLSLTLDQFTDYLNDAKPSPIRIYADELTYCLHIIIRYEIERDIFNGNITNLDELPNIWNKKYNDYLGITVKDDKEGILQDTHWSDASFGYFPDYLLGTIFDGMIYEKIGNVDELLKNGKIIEITKFLNENIHKYAGTYNIFEVSKRVTGKELNTKPIIEYFKNKYM